MFTKGLLPMTVDRIEDREEFVKARLFNSLGLKAKIKALFAESAGLISSSDSEGAAETETKKT